MKKRFSEEQIIGFLREADKGVPMKGLCRNHGFPEASYYLWRSTFGGMDVSDAKRLIEPGKPNQKAYVGSFNGRFRDEWLNEHGGVSLVHARVVIEAWRQKYNDERTKRSLSGLTPAQTPKQRAARPVNMPENSKSTCY